MHLYTEAEMAIKLGITEDEMISMRDLGWHWGEIKGSIKYSDLFIDALEDHINGIRYENV